ncbi:alpha/beta-tubulin-N-acetyltransferase 9 [Malaya genurostris]|uniref:alpha/beta-tubulin-N-acetyltransferase 9 n=1 Tax=Malaya genurostris TaxID=325434 RepID=UPI0026F3A39C|nr:alpha/beta-tubulin-N-acetyltransferase 9 [Malaya genurostris]XP_058465709.1 alpha/beta-tubulin-N-acetyltransferase 9 [Malaya genurostris]
MKLNEHVQIVGTNVILVPYESKHVEKYHRWMMNEELQLLTASEPLTLEEEYQMQQSWRQDEDKLTFLILDASKFKTTGDEIDALIGDTNIFLLPKECDDRDDDLKTAEIEIMIAEQPARGKRYGWESTLLMLQYGIKHLRIQKYRAITKDTNDKAMQMFQKMGFREVKRVAVFQEVTFEVTVNDAWLKWIEQEVSKRIESYH